MPNLLDLPEMGSFAALFAASPVDGAPTTRDVVPAVPHLAAPDPEDDEDDEDEEEDEKSDGNIEPDDDEGYGDDDDEDDDDEEPLQVAPGLSRTSLRGCCGAESASGARTGRRTRHTSPSPR